MLFRSIAKERAKSLRESHCRVRNITKEGQVKVSPRLPMDILGIYILQPTLKSVKEE